MQLEEFTGLERHFYENGWFKMKLPNKEPAIRARNELLDELRKLTSNGSVTLERYHEIADDDSEHTKLQLHLAKFFRERRLGPNIIEGQLDFFKQFIGPDLRVQSEPYLRITRPLKPKDNIDFHRDTLYGGSAFELSVWVPFIDLPAESSLSVLSGSNIRPDSDFPVTQTVNEDPTITKGSDVHKLGFPYAPKKFDPSSLVGLKPVPIKFGEALIFTVATIHGSDLNRGDRTRWSTDCRVSNILAPIDLSGLPGYYENLCMSVVTDRAIHHAEVNSKSDGELIG